MSTDALRSREARPKGLWRFIRSCIRSGRGKSSSLRLRRKCWGEKPLPSLTGWKTRRIMSMPSAKGSLPLLLQTCQRPIRKDSDSLAVICPDSPTSQSLTWFFNLRTCSIPRSRRTLKSQFSRNSTCRITVYQSNCSPRGSTRNLPNWPTTKNGKWSTTTPNWTVMTWAFWAKWSKHSRPNRRQESKDSPKYTTPSTKTFSN